jgi:hypothetical protein
MAHSGEGGDPERAVVATDDLARQVWQTLRYARRAIVLAIAAGSVAILSLLVAVVSFLTMLNFVND